MSGSRQEFYMEHGGEKNCLLVDGVFLFADGAGMERPSYGMYWDPPTDPRELLRAKEKYCDAKLRKAVQRFNELKNQLTWRVGAAMEGKPADVPDHTEISNLRALQTEVHNCQAELEKIREQFDTRTEKQKQHDAAVEASITKHQSDVFKTLESIKI